MGVRRELGDIEGQCPQMGSGAHSIPVCATGQADLYPINLGSRMT